MAYGPLPMKSRLLLRFEEGEYWDYEAIDWLLKEEGLLGSDFWLWDARFWLNELSTNGLLEVIETELDDGSHFKKDVSIAKYRLTDYGKSRIDMMLR